PHALSRKYSRTFRTGQARQQSPRSARVGHRQHTRRLHTRPALHRRSPRGGFAGIYPPGSETERFGEGVCVGHRVLRKGVEHKVEQGAGAPFGLLRSRGTCADHQRPRAARADREDWGVRSKVRPQVY
ncbi:unnamed protein product, partial [Pylaiella littoralis]